MTGGEERIFYSSISIMIFVFAIGIVVGIYFYNWYSGVAEKPEAYYREKSAEIYLLATDYISEKNQVKKKEILRKLKYKISIYNSETSWIKKWKFRCPQTFTIDYLIGDNFDEFR